MNSKEPSANKLGVILHLQGKFPHIVEHILGQLVNDEAILKMERIARWSALFLPTSPIWKLGWQRNVEQFPLWGALSSRAESNKLNDRDAHCYRKLYHSILDSIPKIENNFMKGFDQKTQQRIDFPFEYQWFGVNDSHFFVGKVERNENQMEKEVISEN